LGLFIRSFIKGILCSGWIILITGDLKNIEHLFKLEILNFIITDITKFVHVPGQLDYILHLPHLQAYRLFKIPIQTLKWGLLEHNL
jgi:dTDP-glucose 4,6-dehydratase